MSFVQETHEVRGCKTALKRGGTGKPLLYLHGANGAAAVQPFMEMLAQDYEVLVPEHPGFGASDEPDWLDSIHDLAYFYLDFLDELELNEVHLVGSSIGGWLALELAIRSTARLKCLTLIAPAGLYVPGLKRGDIFLWSPEEKVRNLFTDPVFAECVLANPQSPDAAEIELKNQFTVARLAWEPRLFDPSLHKWLHRVRIPTQIVWGDSDRILPSGYAAEFAKRIPGARVAIVERCGHLPQTEKPGEFTRLLRDFACPT